MVATRENVILNMLIISVNNTPTGNWLALVEEQWDSAQLGGNILGYIFFFSLNNNKTVLLVLCTVTLFIMVFCPDIDIASVDEFMDSQSICFFFSYKCCKKVQNHCTRQIIDTVIMG